jgi:hypothetical protein
MFALCGSPRVGVLPRLDVTRVNRVAFKIAGEPYTIAAALEAM